MKDWVTEGEAEENYQRGIEEYNSKHEWYKNKIQEEVDYQRYDDDLGSKLKLFYKKRNICCILQNTNDKNTKLFLEGEYFMLLEEGVLDFPLFQGTSKFLYLPKQTIKLRKKKYPMIRPINLFPTYSSPLINNFSSQIKQPNQNCDVFYINKNAISPSLHQLLCTELDKIAKKTSDFPVPNYQNIIDPNLLVVNDQWVATDFLIEEEIAWDDEIEEILRLASLESIGVELPPEIIEMIRNFCLNGGNLLVDHIDDFNELDDLSGSSGSDTEFDYNPNLIEMDNKERKRQEFEQVRKEHKIIQEKINKQKHRKNKLKNCKNIEPKKLTAKLMGNVHYLKVEKYQKLHYCIQEVFSAALPLLARLRKPALLLPGILQAVIKAQKIYVDGKEEYLGVWHRDGETENIVAVVLYYYRVSDQFRETSSSPSSSSSTPSSAANIIEEMINDNNNNNNNNNNNRGGKMEFVDKRPIHQPFWIHREGEYTNLTPSIARRKINKLPQCKVEVKEGSLIVFSNYQMIHRVLNMINETDNVLTREFLCFFVVDQAKPLISTREVFNYPKFTSPSNKKENGRKKSSIGSSITTFW